MKLIVKQSPGRIIALGFAAVIAVDPPFAFAHFPATRAGYYCGRVQEWILN